MDPGVCDERFGWVGNWSECSCEEGEGDVGGGCGAIVGYCYGEGEEWG